MPQLRPGVAKEINKGRINFFFFFESLTWPTWCAWPLPSAGIYPASPGPLSCLFLCLVTQVFFHFCFLKHTHLPSCSEACVLTLLCLACCYHLCVPFVSFYWNRFIPAHSSDLGSPISSTGRLFSGSGCIIFPTLLSYGPVIRNWYHSCCLTSFCEIILLILTPLTK